MNPIPIQHGNGSAIIIRRADCEFVHDWAWQSCLRAKQNYGWKLYQSWLRDYLFIRLPMKIGLRTYEISTLKIENINFEKHSFQVLDSKKHRLFPLPLDPITLQLLKDYIGDRTEGYVFERKKKWTVWHGPITKVSVWKKVKRIALLSGIRNWEEFTPRLYRHYFAAWWNYEDESIGKKRGNIELLRRILRHSSLAMTQVYLSRLIFFEDLQKEYDRVESGPFVEMEMEVTKEVSMQIQKVELTSICSDCERLPICKYAPLAPCAESCKYKLPMKKEVTRMTQVNHTLR